MLMVVDTIRFSRTATLFTTMCYSTIRTCTLFFVEIGVLSNVLARVCGLLLPRRLLFNLFVTL
jgi:hypothetical protein